MDGGAGMDDIQYGGVDIPAQGVTVNLATGSAIDSWGNTDTLVSIENAEGTPYADMLTGDSGDNGCGDTTATIRSTAGMEAAG